MNKRSTSNLTKLKKTTPLSDSQLKSLWTTNNKNPQPVKKLRTFNHSNNNTHGKIIIDKHTYVEYDYSKDLPVTLIKKNEHTHAKKDIFTLSKYPILKSIQTDIPHKTDTLKDMDLFLIKDINQAVLWKNNELLHFS